MFIILASFCKISLLTALFVCFFLLPDRLASDFVRAVFLSQRIGSKVSFIYSDSSGSVSATQEGSAVSLDVW